MSREAQDRAVMARALELARRGVYSTPPNPAVGCVLSRDGQIVGEGWHERAGEPHAEVVALRAAGERARGADVHVTLEPCAHQGRTGPCVEALIAAGVARVVAAIGDPNPRVGGKGHERLRQAGISVEVDVLADEARELNRGFFTRMRRARPWVTVKAAMSLDGRSALADGSSQWITGPEARADVQALRARASAIVTGIGTVLADDPQLTVRDAQLELRGRRPLRVVLDPALRTPAESRILRSEAPTLILTTDASLSRSAAVERIQATGSSVESVPEIDGRLDPGAVLARLAALDCNEVLVEAGPRVTGSFLSAALVDELVLYVAPTLLGHTARAVCELPPLQTLAMRSDLDWHDVRRVGGDLRLTLRPRTTKV
jgi:diaminohydroxyphosphoribosylaminopyrimidine deaminase/5-amino-6-(5-phosphoribosylamino)uracil reductase